ncbi:carbohydrate ABC transporter permease [Lacticaseibacillus sp. GG6-2]
MNRKTSWGWHLVLLVVVLVVLLPILYMVGNSFKTLQESYHTVLTLFPLHPTLANYRALNQQIALVRLILNTFGMATIVTLGKLVTGLLAAYAFTYYRFRGRSTAYVLYIATMFVPFTVVMIPNYLVIAKLNLLNSMFGVALPQLCDATGIMLFTRAMAKIPPSLLEAARVDDIPDRRIFTNIVLPLLRPSIISIGAMFFVNSWNEYVWPTLILKDKLSFTLPLALQNYISSEGGTDFPLAMALATIMIVLPLIVYCLFQRYILNSISSQGMK